MTDIGQKDPGWPRVSLPPESVVALRPCMRKDGSRAKARDGRGLWLVYALAPNGTHLGQTDIGGRALCSIARPAQVVGLKDGTARLEDGVDRVSLCFRPDAPLVTYEVTRGEGDAVSLSGEDHGTQDARSLWALVSSVKARRDGVAQPATERQLARIRSLDPQAGPGVDTMSKSEASAYIDSLVASGPGAVGDGRAEQTPPEVAAPERTEPESLESLLAAGRYEEAWSRLESTGLVSALGSMLNGRLSAAWGSLPERLEPSARMRASLSQVGLDVDSLSRPYRGGGAGAPKPASQRAEGRGVDPGAMARLMAERRYDEAQRLIDEAGASSPRDETI